MRLLLPVMARVELFFSERLHVLCNFPVRLRSLCWPIRHMLRLPGRDSCVWRGGQVADFHAPFAHKYKQLHKQLGLPFAESGSPAVWDVYYSGRLRVHVFLRSVKALFFFFFFVLCAKIARFLNEVRGSGLELEMGTQGG